jgi:hypothetical protein
MAIRFAIERANRSSLEMTKMRLYNAAIADEDGLTGTGRSIVPKTPDLWIGAFEVATSFVKLALKKTSFALTRSRQCFWAE